ncbi:MAG: M20 family metallopeptidase [Candidatus Odinarchaeota archaeon]
MSEELILNEIEANTEEYIEFFRELIQTDSYNPPGNEKNVAIKIEKYLANTGIESEIFPFGKNRANLIAYLNDDFAGKNLLYNGHMDVVPPGNEEEWKYSPLSANIKGSKARRKVIGRGTVDMKSGLAAMTIALKTLKKLNLIKSGNLILNAVADEEVGGQVGTLWCLDNLLKSKKINFAVIGEPTGLEPLSKAIIIGEKGRVAVRIITNGISGHASVPILGKNAIYMMSEIIQNLDRIDDFFPKIEPPLPIEKIKELISVVFPNKTVFEKILNEQQVLQNIINANSQFTKNLTMIKGGIKSNVVPDHCEAVIDFRILPGQTVDMVLNSLKQLINELGFEVKNEPIGLPKEIFVYLDIEYAGEASFFSGWEQSKSLNDFYTIVEKVYNKKPFYFLYPASADAKFYRNKDFCQSTILFGPGNAQLAHTTNENIEIKDFINAIKVYTLFAYNFLKD